MSSASRSGNSERIWASDMPAARYSRTSYTVILNPRMHGFPPRLSGSSVMRFRKASMAYSWYSERRPLGQERLAGSAAGEGASVDVVELMKDDAGLGDHLHPKTLKQVLRVLEEEQ